MNANQECLIIISRYYHQSPRPAPDTISNYPKTLAFIGVHQRLKKIWQNL